MAIVSIWREGGDLQETDMKGTREIRGERYETNGGNTVPLDENEDNHHQRTRRRGKRQRLKTISTRPRTNPRQRKEEAEEDISVHPPLHNPPFHNTYDAGSLQHREVGTVRSISGCSNSLSDAFWDARSSSGSSIYVVILFDLGSWITDSGFTTSGSRLSFVFCFLFLLLLSVGLTVVGFSCFALRV